VKYIPDEYINPVRKTDMCSYCDDLRKVRFRLSKLVKAIGGPQATVARVERLPHLLPEDRYKLETFKREMATSY